MVGYGSVVPERGNALDRNLRIMPIPEGIDRAEAFTLTANGVPVPIAKMPAPDVHPHANTNRYAIAHFEADGSVALKATWAGGETNLTVRAPFYGSIEPFGRWKPLVVLVDTIERDAPRPDDKGVRWIGPGRHRLGEIRLGSGETLYLAPGAWVEGCVRASGTDIAVRGRGTLSGAPWKHYAGPSDQPNSLFMASNCKNLRIEGVTFWASFGWTTHLVEVEDTLVDGLKIVNGRTGNDDGIDLCVAHRTEIRNSFILCGDDCLAPKFVCRDLVVTNCTLWCDLANVIRLGYECMPGKDSFRNLLFKDIDVLHSTPRHQRPEKYWTEALIEFNAANDAVFSRITFEDIRVHDSTHLDTNGIFLKTYKIQTGAFDWTPKGFADAGNEGVIDEKTLTIRNVRCLDGTPINVWRNYPVPSRVFRR